MTPLLPPVDHPESLVWKIGFFFMRRKLRGADDEHARARVFEDWPARYRAGA